MARMINASTDTPCSSVPSGYCQLGLASAGPPCRSGLTSRARHQQRRDDGDHREHAERHRAEQADGSPSPAHSSATARGRYDLYGRSGKGLTRRTVPTETCS
nr:hypothetical protein GCM10020092_079370 [Actinoplanes digitatis]